MNITLVKLYGDNMSFKQHTSSSGSIRMLFIGMLIGTVLVLYI